MSILNSQYPVMEMHGTQNTFLVLTDFKELITPSQVKALCDVNTGFNKDGLMTVCTSRIPEAKIRMKFFNFDGSMAEMCGNGIRCFAKYLVDQKLVLETTQIPIDTDAGLLFIDILENFKVEAQVKVNMGVPILDNAEQCTVRLSTDIPITDFTLENKTFHYVGMGNPHAITFTDTPDKDVISIGPKAEVATVFPAKTNVEFLKVHSDDLIEMHVWERGVGITLACGTGACASFVTAKLTKKIKSDEATLRLPGGDLQIAWKGSQHPVFMTGNAVNVAEVNEKHSYFSRLQKGLGIQTV